MISNLQERRLSAQQLSGKERGRLDMLAAAMNQKGVPALVGSSGEQLQLPDAIYKVLRQIVNGMREGRAILLIPENEVLTTQAAADHLGVSRPHLVSLLENGEIPYHTVGTHRRVQFGDVAAYGAKRDQERRQALDEITRMTSEAGYYDQDPQDEG
jgi:excisionase family DNA binding protein